MISLEHVEKRYNRSIDKTPCEVEALRDISLIIRSGEFVVITGSSGAGKTTLLNIIAGIEHPSSGTVTIDGSPIFSLSKRDLAALRNKTIGYMLQFYCLPPHLTMEEQVMLPLLIAGETVAIARKTARLQIQRLGLETLLTALPSELSGGQAQRIGLARALVHTPQIVLADEPTGNLDNETANHLITILRQANSDEGITIVVVSHDDNLVETAQRHIILDSGRIVSDT